MKALLQLQELDLQIEALIARETEIPKQKEKSDIHRKRLATELEEREGAFKELHLEQRNCEGQIEEKQALITKYDRQLFSIKKDEEYRALLHEMDTLKKQVAQIEDRVLGLMMQLDEAKDRLEEDRKRIRQEVEKIGQHCAAIDREFAQTVAERQRIEAQRPSLVAVVDPELLIRYTRIRASKKTGAAVVPLNGETCSGCHMGVPPQIANEVLAGKKVHACLHCGRLLYHRDNVGDTAGDS